LLASAEIDEGFTRCGRYAYCWGRDAAFITGALDTAGLTEAVDKFYQWAVMTRMMTARAAKISHGWKPCPIMGTSDRRDRYPYMGYVKTL